MFRIGGVLAGIGLASVLVYSPALGTEPQTQPFASQQEVITEIPAQLPASVVGYYTKDGGKTFIAIKEQKGIAERIPSGTTKEEFMRAHEMSPEAEAGIVHQVPPVPIVIDGVVYQPEQIHLFDGRQLGFTVGNDGQLYAFTSFTALGSTAGQPGETLTSGMDSYSYFYDYPNFLRVGYWMMAPTSTTFYTLDPMNNMISSEEIGVLADNGATLFEHTNLQGDYFYRNGGTKEDNLGRYGWDNRACSLVVWPQ